MTIKKKIRSIERVYDFYFMITLIANIIKRLDFNVIPELLSSLEEYLATYDFFLKLHTQLYSF